MTTALGHDPGNFYIWRASDDFAIHLSIKLVTQLTTQIARAGSQSQAGELRGILLGRTVDEPFRATVIEDFEVVPAGDDDTDGEQDISDTLLEIACRKARDNQQRVLGFFRSRRDGRLNMSQRDLETFSRLFCETGNVALRIQTSRRGNESDAALFYWEHGGAQPRDFGFGFPFEAGQLVSGHPGWRYPNPFDLAPASASMPPAEPHASEFDPTPLRQPKAVDWTLPSPPASPTGGSGIRWGRLAPTIVLAAICIGALQLATSSKHSVAAATETSETAAPEAAPSVPIAQAAPTNEHTLGLSVTSRQHQLEIRWNRESAAIATSDKAVIKITEDGRTEVVPFDQTQLRDGYVAYTPKTSDVSIRLEVTGKDGATTSESIRSVAIP